MQVNRILILSFWLILPPTLVLLFEKTIIFILTNVDQSLLGPKVYGYLPYLSVFPPLTLLVILWSQIHRSRQILFKLPNLKKFLQMLPMAILLSLVSVSLFKGAFIFLRWCSIETPTFSNFAFEHHLFFSTIGAIIPAVAEEFYFRQFLFQKSEGLNPILVIFLTAASFAMWHILSPTYLLHTFLLGLLYGYFYRKTQNITLVIVAHALANTLAGVLIISGAL